MSGGREGQGREGADWTEGAKNAQRRAGEQVRWMVRKARALLTCDDEMREQRKTEEGEEQDGHEDEDYK